MLNDHQGGPRQEYVPLIPHLTLRGIKDTYLALDSTINPGDIGF